MLRDIKKCIQLTKYSYDYKKQVIWMAAMFFGGLLLLILSKGTAYLAGYFMVLASAMFAQMISNMGFSDLVKSSRLIRPCTVEAVCLVAFVGVTLSYLIVVINALVWCNLCPDMQSSISLTTLMLGATFAMILLYFIMAGKLYWIGLVLFMICFLASYYFFLSKSEGSLYLSEAIAFSVPIWTSVLIGYGIIILAAVLAYIEARLTYKFPISKMAQFSSLRKQLK